MRVRMLAAAAGALLMAGCMGGPHGPPPGSDEDGPPRPRVQLFISPSGQPFRAPPGEAYPSAAWFAEADADRDSRLTRSEFRADAEHWFKALDVDGDGQIAMPEVSRWEETLVPELSRFDGPGGGVARGRNVLDTRREGAAAYSLINEPHPIRGADADFSMRVSAAEWRAAADRRFALLDPDGDGAILPSDLRPTPAQRAPGGDTAPPGRPPRPGR